jgi:glucose/arabinose dehydrogenase
MRRAVIILAATGAVLATAATAAPAGAQVALQPIGRFSSPTYVTAPPGDATRLVVVQRRGAVRLVKRGHTLARPFLDLTRDTLVKDASGTGDQRGMLSLAFAPDYARSGRFYVFYVDRRDRIRVDEVRRSAASPDRADPRTRRTVLAIDGAGPLHHGGQLAFGPDGLLYVGVGYGHDERLAQDLGSLRGKILRIDPTPDAGAPYRVPPRNPFTQTPGARPEVYALGVRNPYRFSFDRPTGDLFVADVGGDDVEELTWLPRGQGAGANLGWSVFEGDERLTAGAVPGAVAPAITHRHGAAWCSIVGGHVAHDRRLPALRGRYVYGDVCSGRVYAARLGGASRVSETRMKLRVPYLVSFGEDAQRRLYAVSLSGGIWRLVPPR